MKNTFKYLLGILVLVGLAGFRFDDRYFEIAKNLDIFATLFKELNTLYVDEISPDKAMQTSIKAMLDELDPYTNFYTEDKIEDYRTMHAGKYNGIGANMNNKYGEHVIEMIYQYSPADEAGLKIGDVITHINGVSLRGRDSEAMGRLLKGQTGTAVELEIKRFGERKPLKISVKRAVVKTPNVPHHGMIDKEIGYIQLSDFNAAAATEIKTAFVELKKEGMQKLILDLRGNGGGLLNQSISICNFFVQKGQLIVETKGKSENWSKKYYGETDAIDTEMPIAVLINGRSASASEIVSGTIQDYDRGVIIGQKSYGKGLVQTTRMLSYNTQLKVTTAKYYIPSGRCIQAIDYSQRNPDGSVGKVPDSLKALFHTKNKRPVYDGGGVDPDILVPNKKLSELSNALLVQGIIFDFATKYYFEHQQEIPGNDFAPSADVYTHFLEFVKKVGFKYDNEATKALTKLEGLIKEDEGYHDLKENVEALKNKVEQKNKVDFERHKAEILNELGLEILSRYHYDKVMKFVSFEKDNEIQEALKVLKDEARYKAILSGKK